MYLLLGLKEQIWSSWRKRQAKRKLKRAFHLLDKAESYLTKYSITMESAETRQWLRTSASVGRQVIEHLPNWKLHVAQKG